MEDIILDEFKELSESLRKQCENGQEVSSEHLFNNNILNVLWTIVTGKRFDLNDQEQKKRIHVSGITQRIQLSK